MRGGESRTTVPGMTSKPPSHLHLGSPVALDLALPRPATARLATQYAVTRVPFLIQAPALYGKTTFAKALAAEWQAKKVLDSHYMNLQARPGIDVAGWLHEVERALAPDNATAVAAAQAADDTLKRKKRLWRAQDRVLAIAVKLPGPTVVLVDEAEGLLGNVREAEDWNDVLRTLSQSRCPLTFGLILRRHYATYAGAHRVEFLSPMKSKYISHDVGFAVPAESALATLYATVVECAAVGQLNLALVRRHCGRHPFLLELLADCSQGDYERSASLGAVLASFNERAREFQAEMIAYVAAWPGREIDQVSGERRHPYQVLVGVSSAWIARRAKGGEVVAQRAMDGLRGAMGPGILRDLGLVEGTGDDCRPFSPGFALQVVASANAVLSEPKGTAMKPEVSAIRKALGVGDLKDVVAFAVQTVALAKTYAEYLHMIGFS